MTGCKLVFGIIFVQVALSVGNLQRFNNCFYTKDECPNEHISFWLYKNETRTTPTKLNPTELSLDLFKPKLPIKILIHGFFGSQHKSPNREIRDPLLDTQRVYVVSVDFEKLVELPCYYPWAPHNARVVGRCVAQFTDNLIDQLGYYSSDIHIISFSLGAQAAGLAANYVNHTLKHITALDPAHLGFTDADPKTHLDNSDADFIDVIHTDPYLFSLLDAVGHADFYVNFPYPIQPGCDFKRNGILYNCNHFRAPIYYAESITATAKFWAKNCGNWSDYLLQLCDNYLKVPNAEMGYYVSKSANGSYFLTTNSQPPFAKGIVN